MSRGLPDDPVSGASLQRLKLVEVNRLRSPGLEIGIDKGSVAYFIIRVARDVLWAIRIEI